MEWEQGLTRVRTKDLKKLLSLLHHKELKTPVNAIELSRCGLPHLVGEVSLLRKLDSAGLHAVLVAVIMERMVENKPRLYIVPHED